MEFFLSWYFLDKNSSSSSYKLKSISETFPNIYNRNTDSIESYKNDLKLFTEVYNRLIQIIQTPFNYSYDESKSDLLKMKRAHTERFLMSGMELLIQEAMKHTHTECLIIQREIEDLNMTSKRAELYANITNGKVDKLKENRQSKFKEMLASKLNDEIKHKFVLKWNQTSGDLTELVNKDNVMYPSNTSNTSISAQLASTVSSSSSITGLNKYDERFKNYLQKLNAILISNIKLMVEKQLNVERTSMNSYEVATYHEATRHFHKYQSLTESNLILSSEFHERLKKLLAHGAKNDHYPIFLYGSSASGKTVTLSRFGSLAAKFVESNNARNMLMVIRYADLTSQCSTFESLLYSVCEQLTIVQKLNPLNEIKNKDLTHLIEYFYKVCSQMSKDKQLLIVIDGLVDVNIDKSLLTKPNIGNNQISWLFHQLLPPGVHLVVSIKRQAQQASNKADQECTQASSSSIGLMKKSSTQQTLNLNAANTVSLFLHIFNEKMSSEPENYLFELPCQLKRTDLNELVNYVKSELAKYDCVLSEDRLNLIVSNIYTNPANASIAFNSNSAASAASGAIGSTSPPNSPNMIETQINFLYLNLLLREITSNTSRFNCKSGYLFSNETFPKDLDSLLKYKLGSFTH